MHSKSDQFLGLKTTQFNQVKNTSTVALADITPVMSGVGSFSAGLYLIPGVGEVLITATGAIIVAGVTVRVGSFLYDTIKTYFAEHTKNKRPSTYDKHTKPRPGRQTEKKRLKNSWENRR